MINLTTGPIQLHTEVRTSMTTYPVSHRSAEFISEFKAFSEFMCSSLNVERMAVLQGSGTLANDAMIWQIQLLEGKGLILSNGEFGNRLIDQAHRADLKFIEHSIDWGKAFDIERIGVIMDSNTLNWILFVHCETATGMLNPLDKLVQMAKQHQLDCFVDCMSTIGALPVELSGVTMATCSSGKGLASISGITMVFSNCPFRTGKNVPKYFDLTLYDQVKIPFTISTVQLSALYVSVKKVFDVEHWNKGDEHSERIYKAFSSSGLIPFANNGNRVFTFVLTQQNSIRICDELCNRGVLLSYQSEYLKRRNWFQLALFGSYTDVELEQAIQLISKLCALDRKYDFKAVQT